MKLALLATLLLSTVPGPTTGQGWKLTPAGWGPVRMGMNRDEVSNALHRELEGEALDNEGSCIELFPKGEDLRGTYFMFLDEKLSRISVVDPGNTRTPRGIHIGSTAHEVKQAYGARLQAEPHHYLDLPAEYLTYWLEPDVRGVRFETDHEGNVQAIHAGTGSIQFVEGCA